MLVVMENRNRHLFFQLLFDIKTLGSLNIFEVDPAKGWLQQFDHADKFIRVGRIDFQIKNINIGKSFKKPQPCLP